MKMVKHKNKLWKIKTRKEHSKDGQDYMFQTQWYKQNGDVGTKEGTL